MKTNKNSSSKGAEKKLQEHTDRNTKKHTHTRKTRHRSGPHAKIQV